MNFGELQALNSLIQTNQPKEEDSNKGRNSNTIRSNPNPSRIPIAKPNRFLQESIWDESGITSTIMDRDNEGLKEPEYDIKYLHSITATDVFLGGSRTPSSADADTMVITIQLPGEKLADLTLDETDTSITLRGTLHKLFFVLPHEGISAQGECTFNSEKEVMQIILPIKR
ncbi:hypothetical protein PCE1_000776 [Barthelona sp. PCE]